MGSATQRWSFLIPIVLFTLVCSLLTWGILRSTGHPMDQVIWGMISYFMLLSIGLHAWQEHSLDRDPQGFIRRYLAGLSIKMLLSLFVLVVLLFVLPRSSRSLVALAFIFLYLAYLIFSTARMAMRLRKISRR